MVCPHGQGGDGIEPVLTYFRRGQFFAILWGRLFMNYPYGTSIKDVRSQRGGRVCPVWTFFEQRGLQMRTSVLLGANIRIFRNL